MSRWGRERDPVEEARHKRQGAWLRFRHKLGLTNLELVAKLLGLSTRSLERYEQDAEPPKWYQAALLGLIETFPDRKKARAARPRKKKKKEDPYAHHYPHTAPPNPYDASRWKKDGSLR